MDWLTNWIFDIFYGIQKTICYIIDFIKDIFYTLAGIKPVTVNGKETDIISNFLLSNNVRIAFWSVMLVAVILLFIFVIIAIIRSEYANPENKKSKGLILSKAGQSFLIFIIIPFILISGITMSNAVVGAVDKSMNPYTVESGHQTTIGGQILVTSGNYAYIGDESERAEIELKFVTGELDYFDSDVVSQYYKIRSMDFFVGILGGLVILVMFVMSSITFIQRIFDIIFLYIISPVCVSTIPVDDGNRFRSWKEMLIAKVLGAYGIILAMNLFFIIIPQVQSITFFNNSFKDGIVKILFLIGGSYAVTKANLVVAQLVGDRTGNQETQQMIANMRNAGNIAKAGVGAVATGAGAIIGGHAFLKGKKDSRSISGGFSNALKNKTSMVEKASETSNKKTDLLKMPTRIASMPIGIMKDLASGGVVNAGKNFVPRLRNAFTGSTILNHPQKKGSKTEQINNKENTV